MDMVAEYRIWGDTLTGPMGLEGQNSSLSEVRNKNNIIGRMLCARACTSLWSFNYCNK